MGKATTILGFWMLVCVFCAIYQQGMYKYQDAPTLSAAIFGDANVLNKYVSYDSRGNGNFSLEKVTGELPTRASTGTEGSGIAYPDWVQSSFEWVQLFTLPIDFIGTPYYFMVWWIGGAEAAIIGGMLSLFNFVIIVAFLMGKFD